MSNGINSNIFFVTEECENTRNQWYDQKQLRQSLALSIKVEELPSNYLRKIAKKLSFQKIPVEF